jgi:hypothetical protein
VLAALAVVFVAFGLYQAWHDAPTVDENTYVAAGVTVLTRHQIRINLEHPPLAKVIAALPVLLAHPTIPLGPSWRAGDEDGYARDFYVAQHSEAERRRIVFLARLMPLAEGVAAAFALEALATSLFAPSAGLLAGALWLTTPFVLGLSHLDTIDVPFALAVLVGCLALIRYQRRPVWGNAVLVGLAGGVCLLVRLTGLIVAPALALSLALGELPQWRRAVGRGLAALVVAWATVWVVVRALAPFPQSIPSAPAHVAVPRSATLLCRLHWPGEYCAGIRALAVISARARPAFLMGLGWTGGRRRYYPEALLVKLPVTVLLVLVIGTAWLALRIPWERQKLALVTLGPSLVGLGVFTFFGQDNQYGLRYLLPVLALWLVVASPLASLVNWRSGRVVLGAGIAAQLAIFGSAWQNALAWTAPPFHPGYRFASDSNLDWGQGLYRLASWSKHRDPWVAYFGADGVYPEQVAQVKELLVPGVDAWSMDQLRPNLSQVRGWVAISASLVTTWGRDDLAWSRAYCPVGELDGSILLYYFATPPDARPGPADPPGVCHPRRGQPDVSVRD